MDKKGLQPYIDATTHPFHGWRVLELGHKTIIIRHPKKKKKMLHQVGLPLLVKEKGNK